VSNRIIASTTAPDGTPVDVTPEAINKFSNAPIEITPWSGNDAPSRYLMLKIRANTKEPAPVLITVEDERNGMTETEELDETELAESLIDAIVVKNGEMANCVLVQDAKERLKRKIISRIWEAEGSIYSGNVIEGFGYVSEGEPIAVVEAIECQGDLLFAVNCHDLENTSKEPSAEGIRLHFLPKGKDKFLVFDIASTTIGEPGSYRLSAETWPSPSNEVVIGDVPKKSSEYTSEEEYLDATRKYLERHMSKGNDKRVELEDDLIF
jgi:hypothetical protein